MNIEELRTELVLEIQDFLNRAEETMFIFLPEFERILAKVELFEETAKSPTVRQILIMLRGKIANYPSFEMKVSREKLLVDLKQLLHFIKGVVPTISETQDSR